jgi:hypothetical protein
MGASESNSELQPEEGRKPVEIDNCPHFRTEKSNGRMWVVYCHGCGAYVPIDFSYPVQHGLIGIDNPQPIDVDWDKKWTFSDGSTISFQNTWDGKWTGHPGGGITFTDFTDQSMKTPDGCVKCEWCGGVGWIEILDEVVKCGTCEGVGRHE